MLRGMHVSKIQSSQLSQIYAILASRNFTKMSYSKVVVCKIYGIGREAKWIYWGAIALELSFKANERETNIDFLLG